jgi:hypothetical protein
MSHRVAVAYGLVGVMSVLRAVAGCSASSSPASNPDASEDAIGNDANAGSDGGDGGFVPRPCNGGCLCSPVDVCPAGCYPSVTEEPDGSGAEPFCSNGITQCVTGGLWWSFGAPATSCPGLNPPGSRTALPDYPVTYLDGGPDGAFCCDLEHEYALIGDAAADTGASDGGTDGAADATGE